MQELIELALAYAPAQIVVGIMVLKGIASVLANNLPTEKWGKFGDLIEVLASNTKGAKLTKDETANKAVKAALKLVKPKTLLGKALKFLS